MSRGPGDTVCSASWEHHRRPKSVSTSAPRKLGEEPQEAGSPALPACVLGFNVISIKPFLTQRQSHSIHIELNCHSIVS